MRSNSSPIRRVFVKPAHHVPGLFPLIIILCQVASAHCAHVFDAYRLVQFDRHSLPLGSRRVTINHVASSARVPSKSESGRGSPSDLQRTITVVRLAELTTSMLSDIVDYRKSSGLLVLLPVDLEGTKQDHLEEVEQVMIGREVDIPVYFAFEDADLSAIADQLERNPKQEGASDSYQFVASNPEASVLSGVTMNNFQGWLHSAPSANIDSDSQPTIAIVAYYDTFAAAPDLAVGADQNGSGVIALLELARIFARLYSEFRTHGPANLLFVLTGAGKLNFAGDKNWLSNVDPRVLEQMEFALCLDSIGNSDSLYLHVSKPPKTPEIKALYQNFKDTAVAMSIPFEVVHKKINLSHPILDWQHEMYRRKQIVSATLSSHSYPSPLFSGAGIWDRRNRINITTLSRNIKFIAESLAKHIYRKQSDVEKRLSRRDRREENDDSDSDTIVSSVPVSTSSMLDVIGGSHDTSPAFIEAWLNFLTAQPRFAPFLNKKSSLLIELERTFSKYLVDVHKTSFALDAEFQFYHSGDAYAGPTKMSVYKVKPFLFDLILAMVIACYLFAFHLYVKYNSLSEAWESLFGKRTKRNKD